MKFSEALRNLDAYPRTLDDFSIRSLSGAAVTLLSVATVVLLVLMELQAYMLPHMTEELFVDTTREHKLRINFDITLHKLACHALSVDAMDATGEHHLAITHSVFKHRLNLQGQPLEQATPIKELVPVSTASPNATCGSCYGAEDAQTRCCNDCDAVLEAYRRRKWSVDYHRIEQCQQRVQEKATIDDFSEGCRVQGHIEVHRISGSFHIAPGNSISVRNLHIHDFDRRNVKVPHTINHLSFGDTIEFANTHPLDGFTQQNKPDNDQNNDYDKGEMHQYFLKIVPTLYQRLQNPAAIYTNQFSVTRSLREVARDTANSMPGIFFSYELSPLMVKYEEQYRTFGHFATNCCCIIGGVFTVAGIAASLINNSWEILQRKLELGKLN